MSQEIPGLGDLPRSYLNPNQGNWGAEAVATKGPPVFKHMPSGAAVSSRWQGLACFRAVLYTTVAMLCRIPLAAYTMINFAHADLYRSRIKITQV